MLQKLTPAQQDAWPRAVRDQYQCRVVPNERNSDVPAMRVLNQKLGGKPQNRWFIMLARL